jgi:hypothetical protein
VQFDIISTSFCQHDYLNYIRVNMKVKYLFNMCLLKVGRMLCNLVIPKLFVSSLFNPVMKRNVLCLTRRKSLINCITLYFIEYSSPLAGFELTTLVVICTDFHRNIQLSYDYDHNGPLSLCMIKLQRLILGKRNKLNHIQVLYNTIK